MGSGRRLNWLLDHVVFFFRPSAFSIPYTQRSRKTQWDHPAGAAPPAPVVPAQVPQSSWAPPTIAAATPHPLPSQGGFGQYPSPQMAQNPQQTPQQQYAFHPSAGAYQSQSAAYPPASSWMTGNVAMAAPPASVIGGSAPPPSNASPVAPVGQLGSIMGMAQAPLSLSEATWDQKQTGVGCSRCQKEFTFLNRRHRCRCCFREYCGFCTVKNHAVPQFGHTQAVRVCDACYSHLSTNRKRCLSRLVPYFERDNVPDSRKSEALGEAYEMLTSGVEILEDAK